VRGAQGGGGPQVRPVVWRATGFLLVAGMAACGGGGLEDGPEWDGNAWTFEVPEATLETRPPPAALEGRPDEFGWVGGADLTCDEDPGGDPVADPAPAIPVVEGLTLVSTWVGQVGGEDDYEHECLSQVTLVTPREVVISTSCPVGRDRALTRGDRRICRSDLRTGRTYIATRGPNSPQMVAGTTADLLSKTSLEELRTAGRSWHRHLRLQRASHLSGLLALARELGLDPGGGPAGLSAQVEGGHAYDIEMDLQGELIRIGMDTLHILVNDRMVPLPVLLAAGELHRADAAEPSIRARLAVLDEPAAPWVLDYEHEATGYRVRFEKITFPAPDELEQGLSEDGQIAVYGIYFELGSAELRDESEAVLREIAKVLRRNPEWNLRIEGHTDSVGGDASNIELSERRSAAVKSALVARHGIEDGRLATAGFGASRPRDTNETPEGRARNRRVELVRQ
jgi:outer membrane protein OmpA-like peptidoglycan-associated protein